MKQRKRVKSIWFLVLFIVLISYIGYKSIHQKVDNTASVSASSILKMDDKTPYIDALVTSVVDGDTLHVLINNKKETVRLVLVDTPETKHPTKPIEPFGPEASKFTKELLEGKVVKLEQDVSATDRYGRLLKYVWLNGQMVNEILLEKGLARVAVFPPDVKYVEAFRAVQKKAQEAKIGIWSLENYVKDNGFEPAATTKATSSNQNVEYASCAAVRAAGKAPIHKADPGYSRLLDRDGDGVGCE
ncbi:nuclease [Paenibacillus psychroresistens]|uniref:Nuclease n=1 Tax=Paenibacillus psychroresistens TaxID=1778678 RepID=A0A6B8RLQ5_9BACL|nr:thermonuclease family protein [Paenibacillus psychroresistens]QGQ96959.1 nuclease [Paenibacillus psychroresistens]